MTVTVMVMLLVLIRVRMMLMIVLMPTVVVCFHGPYLTLVAARRRMFPL